MMKKPEEKKPEETGSKFDKQIVPDAVAKESLPINAADWIAQQKKVEEETPEDVKKPAAADSKKSAPRDHHAKARTPSKEK